MATTTKQPAGEHDVSLLLQQQQQMAARLQQMEQMMEAQRMAHEQQLMMIEGQRRAHELERLRMDLKLALGQADAVSKGGAVPSLRPSADFVRHCVAIQSAARGGERARFWLLQKRSAVKIQARARTWLVMGKLTDAYLAATRIAACARRRAAILKRKRLLEERAAARVQTAFRGYKSTVLDAPAVTKTRLIARMKREGVAMGAVAEADKEVAVAAAVEAAMTAAWAVAEEQKAAAVRAAVAAAVSAERASRLAAARLQEAMAARGAPPSAHDVLGSRCGIGRDVQRAARATHCGAVWCATGCGGCGCDRAGGRHDGGASSRGAGAVARLRGAVQPCQSMRWC